ncbi:hypothetical protein PT2222_170069 [Paraburkholderia tropica]
MGREIYQRFPFASFPGAALGRNVDAIRWNACAKPLVAGMAGLEKQVRVTSATRA